MTRDQMAIVLDGVKDLVEVVLEELAVELPEVECEVMREHLQATVYPEVPETVSHATRVAFSVGMAIACLTVARENLFGKVNE